MPPKRMDSPPPEDAGEEDEEVEVYRNPKGGGLFSSAMAMVQPGGGSSGPRSDAPPEKEPEDARARLALHQSMAERQHVVQVHRLLQRVVSSAPPPWLAKALMKLSPVLAALGKIVNTIGPPLILAWKKAVKIYKVLPSTAVSGLYGLALCFFGGTFHLSIEAVEAFRHTGWSKTKVCLHDIGSAVSTVWAKNKQDNQVDDNHDGIADVRQISADQLVTRKIRLVIDSIDPVVLQQALVGVYHGFLGVLATLRFKFARSITMGLSVGNMTKPLVARMLTPTLKSLLKKEDAEKWSPMIIGYTCKAVAMAVAFYIQERISAVQSAAMGGLMFSRATMKLLRDRGQIKLKEDETNVDEIVGWTVAAVGLYFQFSNGMALPFPFNILLLPLTIVEKVLRYLVIAVPATSRLA